MSAWSSFDQMVRMLGLPRLSSVLKWTSRWTSSSNDRTYRKHPSRSWSSSLRLRLLRCDHPSLLVIVLGVFICLLGCLVSTGLLSSGINGSSSSSQGSFLVRRSADPSSRWAFDASLLVDLDHLVVVTGHAVTMSESLDQADRKDSVWFLFDYQRDQDLPRALTGHIHSGVEMAAADPKSLLIFSGGQTRSQAGPRDEGSSYYRVAEHYRWWQHDAPGVDGEDGGLPVQMRTVTEDFATDSFQNLLFSICRFKEVVGKYPMRITVVGFEFKRDRFVDLHRRAIRFPLLSFRYVGIHPPAGSRFDLEKAARGEREHSMAPFQRDPYGCRAPALAAKRVERNPYHRMAPYPLSTPELRDLLSWCGLGLFRGPLPWDS